MNNYQPPVADLLTLGESAAMAAKWPDYLALGLGPEHVPELVRMMLDPGLNEGDSNTPLVWAPLHAFRALGQLRAVEAVESMIRAVKEDIERDGDWLAESAGEAFGLIGPASLPALTAAVEDSAEEMYQRWRMAEAIAQVGREHPVCRTECVAILSRCLERHAENDPELNGGLVGCLLDLNAVEAAPVIERAFAAGDVEEGIVGDWDEVSEELGVPLDSVGKGPAPAASRPGHSPRARAKDRAKSRRKQTRQARKKNRKKK
jgi:hypothetical protein